MPSRSLTGAALALVLWCLCWCAASIYRNPDDWS